MELPNYNPTYKRLTKSPAPPSRLRLRGETETPNQASSPTPAPDHSSPPPTPTFPEPLTPIIYPTALREGTRQDNKYVAVSPSGSSCRTSRILTIGLCTPVTCYLGIWQSGVLGTREYQQKPQPQISPCSGSSPVNETAPTEEDLGPERCPELQDPRP